MNWNRLAANVLLASPTRGSRPACGLYFYGYRYYDPVTGRWPSRDPIGSRGGINLYAFLMNRAGSWFDVLGLDPSRPAPPPPMPPGVNDPNRPRPDDKGGTQQEQLSGGGVTVTFFIDPCCDAESERRKEWARRFNEGWGGKDREGCMKCIMYTWGGMATIAGGAAAVGVGGIRALGVYIAEEGVSEATGIPLSPADIKDLYKLCKRTDVPGWNSLADELPTQSVPNSTGGKTHGVPLPDPDANGAPHTVIGERIGGDGVPYRQTGTFPDGSDIPWSRRDWADHPYLPGEPHPNPHDHILIQDPKNPNIWDISVPSPSLIIPGKK